MTGGGVSVKDGKLSVQQVQFYFRMKKVLEMDGGDRLHNNINVFNVTELYTQK
jgi:hypothetical protein